MSSIFISHSSEDNQVAEELRARLADKGYYSVFLDFDPALGIPAGRDWERELYTQLRACRAVIVLWSAHSFASRWCFAEITHARSLGKHVFPIRIDSAPLDPLLMRGQLIDASAGWEEAYTRLWRGLLSAGLDPKNPLTWDPTRPPYPGLLAFQENDAAIFFGRDTEIREGMDLLNKLHRFGGPRMVQVLGSSGSGKSSLLRAGLLPRLRRDPSTWLLVGPFRPLGRPLAEFSRALAMTFANVGVQQDWRTIAEKLRASETGPESGVDAIEELLNDLCDRPGHEESTVLLAVDQFDELLADTAATDESYFLRFLADLPGCARRKVLVLGTLRSDFLGALQEHPTFRGLPFESLTVGPMTKAALADVISGPATVAGIELEPGLVHAMVDDTETADALPLLAFSLRELWERHGGDGVFRVQEYRDDLGGLGGVVARTAEAVLGAYFVETRRGSAEGGSVHLTDEDAAILRQTFLGMARVDENGRYARQAVKWIDLPAGVHDLLQRFVAARLLVLRADGREVEVAHEALFRTWARLVQWLNENRDLLVWRRRVTQAFEAWQLMERHESQLLSGPALVEALGWLMRHDAGQVRLSQDELTLIRASDQREQSERVARERQHLKEVEQARALAEEQTRRLHASYLNRITSAERYWVEGNLRKSDAALGQYGADGECGWEWRYLKRLLRSQLLVFGSHLSGASGLGFVPGIPVRLVSTGYDGSVRLWSLGESRLVCTPASDRAVIGFSISAAGKLAVADELGTVRFWHDVGSPSVTLDGERVDTAGNFVLGGVLALSSDGKRLATIVQQRVRVRDIGSEHDLLTTQPARYRKVAFLPDGESILSLTRSPNFVDDGRVGALSVWKIGGGTTDRTLNLRDVNDFAMSPDGRLVAIGTESGLVVWDLGNGSHIALSSSELPARFVALSPDGDRIAVAAADGTVEIWRAKDKRQLLSLRVSSAGAAPIAFSPDGRAIATSAAGVITLWDATTAQSAIAVAHDTFESYEVTAPSGQSTRFGGLSDYQPGVMPVLTADGRFLVAMGEAAVVYDVATGRDVFRTDFPSSRGQAAITSDGGLVAVSKGQPLYDGDPLAGRRSAPVRVFKLPTGIESPPIIPDIDWVDGLIFDGDGGSLVTLGRGNSDMRRLSVWSLNENHEQLPLGRGKKLAGPLARGLGDKKLIAAVGDESANIVHVWDAATGRLVAALPPATAKISTLAFGGADDGMLAVGDSEGDFRIWNLVGAQEVFSVTAGSGEIVSALLTKDCKRAFVGERDGDIRVLSVPSGNEVLVLHGHQAPVLSLAFTTDEDALISASSDGVVRRWCSDYRDSDPPDEQSSRRYKSFAERAPASHLEEAKAAGFRDKDKSTASFHLDWIDPAEIHEIPFLIRIGQAEGSLGRWQRAWNAISRAANLGNVPPWVSFQCALLAVRLGYQAEFERRCEILLDCAEGDSAATGLGALAVRTCVLSPLSRGAPDSAANSIAARVLAIASMLPPPSQYERSRLGPALHRTGAQPRAIAELTSRAKEDLLWSDYDRIFRALALHATGKKSAASEEASRVKDSLARERGLNWDDRLELTLVYEELTSEFSGEPHSRRSSRGVIKGGFENEG